jgi:Spx/MgsR family transcriptional regulator
MMQLYGIPNCNTVKKARAWLAETHIAVQFHDFKKDGVSAPLINGWLEQMPWDKLVNRAGMTWRGLSDAAKADVQDGPSALRLMLEKPSVIKRPILVRDGKILLLGFDETAYGKLLTK